MNARRLAAAAALLAAALVGVGPRPPSVRADSSSPSAREDQVLVAPSTGADLTTLYETLGVSVVQTFDDTGWVAVSVPVTTTASSLVDTLKSSDGVADAQLDYTYEPQGVYWPSGGEELATYVPDQSELLRIGADDARTRATGDGVRVAVVDTGILASLAGVYGHVDSDGYDCWNDDSDPTDETNGIDDDSDGNVDNMYGHGTFVASLVLAVAPDARIVPFRAIDADGRTSSSLLAAGITQAVNAGIDVINLSVSVPSTDSLLRAAIYRARDSGVQVISAAGNAHVDVGAKPTALADLVVVASVGSDDVLADFSSFGAGVDLCAPGVDLYGVWPDETWGTAIWSGTSFSTALVVGGFALLREQHPTWSRGDIVTHLKSTAASISSVNSSSLAGKLGAGRLDLDAATSD